MADQGKDSNALPLRQERGKEKKMVAVLEIGNYD
jgi:hypothetical protein